MVQHPSSLWSSIHFRALSSPAFNTTLIIYQFQSNIHPIIQQASDILSISQQHKTQHSTILWYSINFTALSNPPFNKPLILYQFKSKIQPNQSLFLTIPHSTNTISGPTSSITTLTISPSTSYYLNHYDLDNTLKSICTDLKYINNMIAIFLDKYETFEKKKKNW